jgi:hypothetical protein
MLMLQAMGLGGWMFDGIDRYTVLGASGEPEVPNQGSESRRAGVKRTRSAASWSQIRTVEKPSAIFQTVS